MDTEGVEGIVVTEFGFDDGDGEVADDTADSADDQGRKGSDEASCRCDGNQAGDAARSGTEDGRFTLDNPFDGNPGDGSCRSGSLRSDEGAGSQSVGAERTAGIETEPAEPEKSRTEDGHGQVMRNHGDFPIAIAFAQEDAEGQARNTGEDVDDQAAGEVEGTEFSQEAAAPDPVCHGVVDEDSPEQDEDDESVELHAFGESAGDQGRCDDGEHALEGDESHFRNRPVFQDSHADAGKTDFIKRTDETINIRTESHGIADEDPFYGNHGDDEEALHNRRQDVLVADHAAVEEAKARCHDEYQGCADEDPGRIACIDRPRIGSEGCRRCHEQTREQHS